LFTVLKPNTWFPASRLPDDFHYLVGQSEGAAPALEPTSLLEQKARNHADSQETAMPLQIIKWSTHDHRLMRTALIVLAAIVISFFLLWCVPFIEGTSA
jgi:hypothetical protein